MPWPTLVLMFVGAVLPGQATDGARQESDIPAVVLEDVEVTARRGSALVAPEREYDGAAIDAFAAWDISEVIARASERAGDREPPVIIVNGERVADPSIFLGFPPDAMSRLELLPPEAAAAYGAAPGRRVMNLVMERRFDSTALQVGGSRPTAGGTSTLEADLRRSSLNNRTATIFGGRTAGTSSLHVDERTDYTQALPGGEAVTLRPQTRTLAVNAALSRPIGEWSSSLRLDASTASSRSVAALEGVPTRNRNDTDYLALTAGLNGEFFGWQTQAELNAALNRSEQSGLTDSRQQTQSLDGSIFANRTLKTLPAGDLRANLSVGHNRAWSTTERATSDPRLPNEDRSTQGSNLRGILTLPLFRRPQADEDRFSVGDLSVSLGGNLAVSDVGEGRGVDLDLNWTPVERLRLDAGLSSNTSAPMAQQLYAPLTYGDPVTVFDLATGESIQIVPILGGNPDLRAQRNHRLNAGLSLGPFTKRELQLNLDYNRAEARDGIDRLSEPTPALETAFPDRFIRDDAGRLVSIDQRPLNLATATSETIGASFNARLPLPWTFDGERQTFQFSANHAYRLADVSRFGPGAPELDRLAGVGGGQPRQTVGFFADARRGRWSLNASGQWRSSYRLRRDDQPGPDDLMVSALGMVSLKIGFVVMPRQSHGAMAAGAPGGGRMSGGGQITLDIQNLFDARPDASLADGRPAPGYGRDDRDPLGRQIRLQFAKRF